MSHQLANIPFLHFIIDFSHLNLQKTLIIIPITHF